MNSTEIAVLFLFSFTGLCNMVIGKIIKRMGLADLISGYDSKLDDKDYVANLFGTHMFLLGCLEIFSSIIYIVILLFSENENSALYFIISNILMIVFICAKMYHNMNEDRKRKHNKV